MSFAKLRIGLGWQENGGNGGKRLGLVVRRLLVE